MQNLLQNFKTSFKIGLYSNPLYFFSVKHKFHKFSHQQKQFNIWKIVRGDKVEVITGKDKGKQGVVLKVYRKSNKVKIDGINIVRSLTGDPDEGTKGGILPIIHPIHISNVSLIDPETQKPARIRFAYTGEGTKVRVSKKSGAILEKPVHEELRYEERHKDKQDGNFDTSAALAREITYFGEDFDEIKAEFDQYISEKERRERLLVFNE